MSQNDQIIEVLLDGVESVYVRGELAKKLASGRQLRIKFGMDPTAPDIHLGHTVPMRKLRQFQDLGHLVVLIIGDYTARIGDPSGRDTTRPILDEGQIKANAKTYFDQATQILDPDKAKLEVHYNSHWLNEMNFAQVLGLTGQVTVQQMLHRDNFKKRMAEDREIMVSEFMYPLMQAYDSVVVKADVEFGGSDQTFNCLMARDLMPKYGLEKQVVFIMPMLVGLDGQEKMSKSIGNYIGVTDEPNDMFGKIMSIPDSLMAEYYRLLTDFPLHRISELVDSDRTHPRDAKDTLGHAIVEQYHGENAAGMASKEFRRQFSENKLPSDIEVKVVDTSPIGILTLITKVGFASSNSEARRLVQQGAVVFDNCKLTDPTAQVDVSAQQILKVGKRRVCRVERN
ncbi:MAG: tyrosine--tRNA ligase [Phycisphaeraceae bacterium]|nr:tyrosine--tRNA ligase [Phycisphaeraceae bacterium]